MYFTELFNQLPEMEQEELEAIMLAVAKQMVSNDDEKELEGIIQAIENEIIPQDNSEIIYETITKYDPPINISDMLGGK